MKTIHALLLTGLLASACLSRAELDVAGRVEVIPIPRRAHVPINFSGSGADDVTMIALDDAGNAAYAAPKPNSTPGNVVSNTLLNSLLNEPPDNFVPIRYVTVQVEEGRQEEILEYYSLAGITPGGELFFSLESYGNPAELCGTRSARVRAGTPHYLELPPPLLRDLRHVPLEIDVGGANASGYWGGGGGATDDSYSAYGGFFFIRTGEQCTIFDGTLRSQYHYQPWLGSQIPSSATLRIVSGDFAPDRANANGWSLGNSVAGHWQSRNSEGIVTSPLLWNGEEILPLPGSGVALNDANDVLVSGFAPGDDMAALLERGNPESRRPFRREGPIRGLIPLALQSQLRNIEPLLLSNRRTVAGTHTQPVLHIAFAAETRRSAGGDGWVRAVFLLRMLSNNTTDLYEIPGAQYLDLRAINKNGLLAGIGTPADQTAKQALLLLPVDMAVDSNRDGAIKFAGNFNSTDPVLAGKPQDKTEETKPFRFWCNEDFDSGDADYPDASSSNTGDLKINCKRDLEDYARLHINIGGLQDAIVNGDIQVGLEWRNTTGSPSIKICRAVEPDGGNEYVQGGADGNENWAGSQILLPDASLLGPIDSGGGFKFPTSFWQSGSYGLPALSADHPNRYLLFDGITEGKGQLVLTFWKGTDKIGEGPGVWLEIKPIEKMYQRCDGSGQNQWPNVQFEADPKEEKQAIVFVHGWRMSPTGASSFAESMFKRLWHRGYKGRFAAFRWNTHWSSDFEWLPYVGGAIDSYLAEYNNSEHNAWLAGEALKIFINDGLPSNYAKNIAAHSMGNIVTGSALLAGANIQNYALLQAAVPAACYDEDEGRIKQATVYNHTAGPLTFTMWDRLTPDNDADLAVRAVAYRGRLKEVGGNLVNFFLPEDYATSFAWEINNHETKPPDGPLEANFHYWRSNQSGQKIFKYHYTSFPVNEVIDYYLTDPSQAYEAMPYACRTWGKAVGAWGPVRNEPGTQGAIDASVNLGESAFQLPDQTKSGFGEAHSGEFDANIQQLKPFYDTLMEELKLTPNP